VEQGPAETSGRLRRVGLLISLILLAAVLRLYRLGRQSLWVDEGYTAYLSGLTPVGYVRDVLHTVRNILPPLYFALMHYWTALVGTSEVTLRFPSAVAGVLAVPLLYALVVRLFDVPAAMLSAAALTVSLFHLHYAQEARMYTLLALLSLLSLYLLVRLLDQGHPWLLYGLAVTDVLIVYTHHYGALLLIAEAGYVATVALAGNLDRDSLRRWLLSRLIFGVLVLPWALFFVNQLGKVTDYPWLTPVSLRSLYDVLVYFAGSTWSLAVLGVLIVLGAGVRRGLPGRLLARQGLTRDDRGYLLMWWAFAAPMLLAFGYSVVVSPVFGRKYLIASSVPFLVLAMVGARALPGRVLPVAALVVAVATAAPQFGHFYRGVTKEQWRESTTYVESQAAPGDLVLVNAGYGLKNGFDFYARRDDLDTRAFPLGSEEFALVPTPQQLAGLEPLVAGRRHAWIVYSQSPDREVVIAKELGRLSTGGHCRDFFGVVVCRYDLRPAAG
jgi:4-amino-4-deoxy-L-arabinose transferase-like glycosyltransferase